MFGIKKTVYLGTGAAIAAALLLGWSTFSSYARTGARMAAESAHDAVPVTFEINRLETLINDLDQVMIEQRGKLIKQEVDIEYLQQDVQRAKTRQDHLAQEVGAARDILAVQRDVYLIGNKEYEYQVVAQEATNKAEALTRARSIYDAKEQTLHALRSAVHQAETQLNRAQQQREQYSVRLSQLEAQAENIAIRSELITSLDTLPNQIDAGAFQEVEANFTRLERELAVQQRALDERYDAAPRAEQISFSAPEKQDVLGFLDAALAQPQTAEKATTKQVQFSATGTDASIAMNE